MQTINQKPNIDGFENLENYELEKYGFGDNYERKEFNDYNPIDKQIGLENNNYNRNEEVDSYQKIYEEHKKKMQMDSQGLKSQYHPSNNSSNMINPYEVIFFLKY